MLRLTTVFFLVILGAHCGPRPPESAEQSAPKPEQVNESAPEPKDETCDFSRFKPMRLGVSTDGYATSLPRPAYPAEAKKQKAEGQVTVKLLVNVTSGLVERACIIKGEKVFEQTSRDAALRSKFSFSGNKALPKQYHYAEGTLIYRFVSE